MARASPDIKAAAMADLLAGEQPAVVAERYKLNPATVRSWKLRDDATIIATDATPVARQIRPSVEDRKQRIAELILDLLAAKLEASQRLTVYLSDPGFVAKQKVEQLVALNDYFDRTALTLGDRLAGASADGDPPDLS